MKNKEIIAPSIPRQKKIGAELGYSGLDSCLSLNFSEFHINPILLKDEFNNHFKDNEHFSLVMSCFLGKILPNITTHKYSDICEGGSQNRTIHFHTVDDEHLELVNKILKEYGFTESRIEQMLEGGRIFSFSACLGHVAPARIVCHKIGNIVCLLFFDTNHHIYINERLVKETFFYESCPKYLENNCSYMPTDCFAFEYLDKKKIADSFGYEYSPSEGRI